LAYASIYHLSPDNMRSYVDFLRNYKPSVVMGYPSALQTLAEYAIEHDYLPAPAEVVITSSEILSERARQAIEQTWQCSVRDGYGAVEGCVFAFQCEFGSYHVSPDVGMTEIIAETGAPCHPGELGEVVCTGFHNLLQPLIRYRLGDQARWAVEQRCRCGREMPILERIEGRHEDMCVTPDGRSVLRFDTVFKGIETIREAQVVQERADLFRLLIVPSRDYDELTHAKALAENMRLHVGSSARVEVTTVSEIPRSASGKFRAVVCRLSEEEKRRLLRHAG
jgi:phenylacetate-CoA ligase